MTTNQYEFQQNYAEIALQKGIIEKRLDSELYRRLRCLAGLGGWHKMNVGKLMLRSIYEGYIPCILLAVIGFQTLGGGILAWMTFVWVFGAVMTVGVACLRTRTMHAPLVANARVSSVLENY